MTNRNKIMTFMLLFFLISGIVTVAFNPVSASELIEDSWNTKTPMQHVRAGLGVIAVEGKIYALGGYGVDDVIVGTNERYDPKTDTWTTMTAMPTPRSQFTIATYQGKIYCIGGFNATIRGWGDIVIPCNVVEVYDTITDNWSAKTSYPFKGAGMCANVVDGQIFMVYGGDLFMYDIATDYWSQKTSMPGRSPSYINPVVIDNKIIFTDAIQFNGKTQKIMIYDTKTDVWSEGQGDSLGGINGCAAVVTSGIRAPQKIYALCLADLHVYDPVSNTWSTATSSPTTRRNFGMAIVDDVLYVIGGYISPDILSFYGSVEIVATNEQYVPLGYRSTAYTTPAPSNSGLSEPETLIRLPFLNPSMTVTALILTIGVVVVSSFVYLNKRKKRFTRNTTNLIHKAK